MVNLNQISIGHVLAKHRQLKSAGVECFALRSQIIVMTYLKEHDEIGYVEMRASLPVERVIEIDAIIAPEYAHYLTDKERSRTL